MKEPGKFPEKSQGSASGDANQWGAAVFASLDAVAREIKSTRPKIFQAAQEAVRQHLSAPEIEKSLVDHQLAEQKAKDAEKEGAKPRFIKTDLLWLNQFTMADDDAVRKTINNGGRQLLRIIPFLSSACATLDSRAIGKWTASDYENFLKFGTHPDRAFSDAGHPSYAATLPLRPVALGDPSLADADAFYNAERESFNAIAADLDIRRTIYSRTQPPGIAGRLFSGDARPLDLILITGPSGSGKSVLLDRIAHDAIQKGWSAYRCHGAQIANADGIAGPLGALTASGVRKILLLIDDANEALRRGLSLQHLNQFALGDPGTMIKIVLAANINLLSADLRSTIPSAENVAIYSIAALDEDELHELVHKLAAAEDSGIIRQRRSSLTAQERLALLQLPRDRIIVIALLVLRYGQSIREIIRDEFTPLTSNTKRILRRCAIYAQFDAGFPAAKAAELRLNPESAPEFRHLTRQENGFCYVRHARLNQPTLDVALPDAQDRCDELIATLREANGWTDIDSAVLVGIFTAPRIAPRIKRLFKHDMDVVRTFVETMQHLRSEFVDGKYGALFFGFLGQIAKDGLSDYDCAAKLFEQACALDQDSAFIRRQLAWSYHKLGDVAALTTAARAALRDFPEAVDLRADCATLLARSVKPDNIEIAFNEISALVRANPQDRRLRRQKEVIEQFERIRELEPTLSEEWAINELPLDRFAARVRRNGDKYYKRRLFGNLRSALQGLASDIELENEVKAIEISRADKPLRALIKSNMARSLYQRWYEEQDSDLDLELIEALLRDAITLWPDEPFAHCWLGTFLKETRRDFAGAMNEYRIAWKASKRPGSEQVVDHPLILNNMALLKMDLVREKKEPSQAGLNEAWKYLSIALGKSIDFPEFTWPLHTKLELEQLFEIENLKFPPAAEPK